MTKPRTILFLFVVLSILMAACGKMEDTAALTVESYLNALVSKDATRIASLSCADWEMQALLELDSFQAVETSLEDLSCTAIVEDDGTYSVNCSGKILATYNTEVQELDLSGRTFIVIEQGGDHLVCGYR